MSRTPLLDGLRRLRSDHYRTFGKVAGVVVFNDDLLDDIANEIAVEAESAWRRPWEDKYTFLDRLKRDLRKGEIFYMGMKLRFD